MVLFDQTNLGSGGRGLRGPSLHFRDPGVFNAGATDGDPAGRRSRHFSVAELAPLRKVSTTCAFLIELLAAIPSVVYGLIGVFVLVPIMRVYVQPFLIRTLGFLPLFRGPAYGVGMLTAAVILAIMIVPFITTISCEIFLSVPVFS